MVDIFTGHRRLATEYLRTLFNGVGRINPSRRMETCVPRGGRIAIVSDFHEFQATRRREILRTYDHLCAFWWNDEKELLRCADEHPQLLREYSVTHCFFFEEPCRQLEALGASSLFVKPLFPSPGRFSRLPRVMGGSIPRYLVAMEVDWEVPTEPSSCSSRYAEANFDRRVFLESVADRKDFLFVGRDLRQMRHISLPTIPQRNPGLPQLMPLIAFLSCGVIELGSKSARSSITPRVADALAVGTPVHALAFEDDVIKLEGIQWHQSISALASIPPAVKVTDEERWHIIDSFRWSQKEERLRILSQIGISIDESN